MQGPWGITFLECWKKSKILTKKTAERECGCSSCGWWRRDRDSNPRSAFGAYTLSRRAPSTTRPSLLFFGRQKYENLRQNAHFCNIFLLFQFFRKILLWDSEGLKKYCTFARLNFKTEKSYKSVRKRRLQSQHNPTEAASVAEVPRKKRTLIRSMSSLRHRP